MPIEQQPYRVEVDPLFAGAAKKSYVIVRPDGTSFSWAVMDGPDGELAAQTVCEELNRAVELERKLRAKRLGSGADPSENYWQFIAENLIRSPQDRAVSTLISVYSLGFSDGCEKREDTSIFRAPRWANKRFTRRELHQRRKKVSAC